MNNKIKKRKKENAHFQSGTKRKKNKQKQNKRKPAKTAAS